jgi:secreted trypsin-like serine protease
VAIINSGAKKGEEFDAFWCAGSLISDTWILTTAWCLSSEEGGALKPADLNVYAGSLDFKKGDRITVKALHNHPEYDAVSHENDIGLVELTRAPRNVKVGKIGLVSAANEASLLRTGAPVTVIGWGMTEDGEGLSDKLRETSVQVVDRASCNKAILAYRTEQLDYDLAPLVGTFRLTPEKLEAVKDLIVKSAGALISENMFCAGDPKAKETARDTCDGDNGGPVIAKGPDGNPVQVGLTSWGVTCGNPDNPGVYTRLSRYTDWVRGKAK